MNRLTDRSKEIPLPCAYNASSFWARVHEKLARYEDTGLEPEEVERYAKAEKDGRLLVPPCKVGDIVFLIVQGMFSPMPVPVCSLTWRSGKWSINADREETEPPKVVNFQIGKTAFLTREDAEKALEVMNNDER
jgi:hypothetical protein